MIFSNQHIRTLVHIDQTDNSWARNMINILISYYSLWYLNYWKILVCWVLVKCKFVHRPTKPFAKKYQNIVLLNLRKILAGKCSYSNSIPLSTITNTYETRRHARKTHTQDPHTHRHARTRTYARAHTHIQQTRKTCWNNFFFTKVIIQ